MSKKIKLGTIVTDKITGLVGIAVARTEYLTGCIHIGIQAAANNGIVPSTYWTDEINLSRVPVGKKRKQR